MKISTVIACHNGARTLRLCLDSLRKIKRTDFEVIVADDGSTDDSPAIAQSLGATVLRLKKRGRPAALNAGIEKARGEIICFTDSDCTVPPTWADALEDALAPGFDGVGGNLVPSAWTVVEIAKVLRYVHEFEGNAVLQGAYSGRCLNGNNMAIRKAALKSVGGFDEGYLHGADADLTRRLLEKGFRLLRTTKVETRHLKVESLASFLRTSFFRGSAVRFAMRDGPLPRFFLIRAYLSAFSRLVEDFRKRSALHRRFPELPGTKTILAPPAHFLADLSSATGQARFHRKFSKEDGA